MKKRKTVKKILLCTALFLLAATLYIALGTTLPYIKHKAPSDEAVEKAENTVYTGDGSQGEKIKNITDNKEALYYRLRLIDEATDEIVLASFEFFDDESGRDILSALWSAAERGVKVNLLIDGYKMSDLTGSPYLRLLASSENAEIKFYNPLTPLFPWKAQSRMHDKYLICDKSIYIVGGRNTNDRFLGEYSVKAPTSDRDLLVISDYDSPESSAKALYAYFEKSFEHDDNKSFSKDSISAADAAASRMEALRTEYKAFFASADIDAGTYTANKITLITGDISTGNKSPDVWYQLVEFMKLGNEALIQTPYIMCSDEMYSDLSSISDGRNIKLFINSPITGSNLFGGVDYLSEKDNILALGMTVYEYTSAIPFHTKTVIVDDRLTAIGSFNFDMRSAYLDSELMLVIDCEELNTEIRAELEELEASSRCISPDGNITDGEAYFEPDISFSENLKRFLLKIFTRPIRFLL